MCTHLDISTASVVSDSFTDQEEGFLHLAVLGFVGEPDDPAVMPGYITGTPVDSGQTGILSLESFLALHHLNLHGAPREVLPDVLLHPGGGGPLRVAAANVPAHDPASLDSESLVQHSLGSRPAHARHLAALLLPQISDLKRDVQRGQSSQ